MTSNKKAGSPNQWYCAISDSIIFGSYDHRKGIKYAKNTGFLWITEKWKSDKIERLWNNVFKK